jgi:hypothetical protein
MDEQDKKNDDIAVTETVNTDPAPPAEATVEKEAEAAAPAEVTVEKEAEAAPPPAEVTEVTAEPSAAATSSAEPAGGEISEGPRPVCSLL